MSMKRDECFHVLAEHVGTEIVVATYTSAFDWMAIRPSPLNYVAIGAMGLASSHALGIALGRPDRKVCVLDGDGSLLMNLGSLVTIAEAAPANLVHFVSVNGTYEANGGHPIPGKDRVDFAQLARAAGYRATFSFHLLPDFRAGLSEVIGSAGPVFVALHVVPGKSSPQNYAYIHGAQAREAFRAALQALRPG